jgi:hypothetical protein
MGAFQWIARSHVVEIRYLIRIGSVAFPAVPSLKLPAMWVVWFMAGTATPNPSGFLQKSMFEPVNSENHGLVTEVTAWGSEGLFMRVVLPMASVARTRILESEYESPIVSGPFFVTGRAGRDGMGPRHLKTKLHLVLGAVIVRRNPRVGAMAKVTATVFEDSLVSVRVAGGASLVLRARIGVPCCTRWEPQVDLAADRLRRRMTSHAFRLGMPSHQGKPSGIMVEGGFHRGPVYPVPSCRGVALPAAAFHGTIVWILVT